MPEEPSTSYPIIRDAGLCAMLVTFAETLSDSANRAALAFRAAVDLAGWEGVEETAISLASTFIRFDPLTLPHATLEARLSALLNTQDWTQAPLPGGRKLWRIPVALGGVHGPQFDEAIALAGLDADTARAQITAARTRVLTLGFAPGQPYLGELPPHWDIPRMNTLNPKVPGGALVVAIRQLIIFAGPAPTGWRQIGQTAFACFRPQAAHPIAFTPGDEVMFFEVTAEQLPQIAASDPTGMGGATQEEIA